MTHEPARVAPWFRAVVGSALAAALGCSTPGQLLVVVDSDLEVGTEIGALEAVAGEVGGLSAAHRFEAPFALPLSFGVTGPRLGAVPMRVTVSAWQPDGSGLVQRTQETTLVEGRILRVDLPLARACSRSAVELDCGDGTTCVDGACEVSFVEPGSLREGDPGAPPPELFEGTPTPLDAGAPDGGPECVEGAACIYPRGCRDGQLSCSAQPPTCEPVGPPMPEGTACGQGRTCDAEGVCAR